eukprot:CAMPEP_0185422836 /NCGR_PEP_ID=MMETSP1365-20130426/12055_1 /TAXON_ID=38817 /ORGANISM="Gephyrocapsa oceanica, Strain RCC1303" /LENGTH=54 /DNA_ID=CAMNT_0028026659 /DNA_START=50 /DNA_END=214 /DNA_ORIENTATION=-
MTASTGGVGAASRTGSGATAAAGAAVGSVGLGFGGNDGGFTGCPALSVPKQTAP